jgi:hypothetical protein
VLFERPSRECLLQQRRVQRQESVAISMAVVSGRSTQRSNIHRIVRVSTPCRRMGAIVIEELLRFVCDGATDFAIRGETAEYLRLKVRRRRTRS